jgi:hypothetical protein
MSLSAKLSLILIFFLTGQFIGSFIFPLILEYRTSFGYLLIFFSTLLILATLTKRSIRFISILLICLGLGLVSYYYFLPIENENHISSYTNQKVEVKGWICSQPEKLVDKNRYQVCPLRLQVNKRTISNPRGKILLSLDVSRDEYSYGQVIGFSDKLYKPKVYPDFNYQAYLANQKICATSYPNNLKTVSDSYHPDSFFKSLQVNIYSQIYSLKNYLIDISNQLFSAPFSSLFNGLLFGQTSGFGDSLKSAFVDS